MKHKIELGQVYYNQERKEVAIITKIDENFVWWLQGRFINRDDLSACEAGFFADNGYVLQTELPDNGYVGEPIPHYEIEVGQLYQRFCPDSGVALTKEGKHIFVLILEIEDDYWCKWWDSENKCYERDTLLFLQQGYFQREGYRLV